MATDSSVVTRLQAIGVEKYQSDMHKSAKSVEGIGASTDKTATKTGKLRSSLGRMAGAFSVYKGAQYIKDAVKTTTDLAKATGGLQRITGMDTRTASGWVGVAKQRGVQSKQLNQGFVSLSKNISAAAGGSKTSAKAFAALGLDAANLKVQDSQTQMSMLADSFAALPAGVDKAALAQKLFGRQAQTMLPLLNQGSQKLNKQVHTMAKSTGVTDKSQKKSMELVKSQREMQTAMMSLQVTVGTALIPILQEVAKVVVPIMTKFSALMQKSGVFRGVIIALAAGLAILVLGLGWIPAAIAAVITGLIILYQNCATFRNIVQAVMHAAVAAFEWLKTAAVNVATAVIGAFNWIKNAVSGVFNWIKGAVGTVTSALTGAFNTAKDAIVGAFNKVKGAVKSVIDFVGKIPGEVGKAFTSAVSKAESIVSGFADIGKSIVTSIVSGITGAPRGDPVGDQVAPPRREGREDHRQGDPRSAARRRDGPRRPGDGGGGRPRARPPARRRPRHPHPIVRACPGARRWRSDDREPVSRPAAGGIGSSSA